MENPGGGVKLLTSIVQTRERYRNHVGLAEVFSSWQNTDNTAGAGAGWGWGGGGRGCCFVIVPHAYRGEGEVLIIFVQE